MIVYAWHREFRVYCFDAEMPKVERVDEKTLRIVPRERTVFEIVPDDMIPMMPGLGCIKMFNFHQLWGQATQLPSYDKKFWMEMQRRLEC